MKLKFYGARGSIPSSRPSTRKFGGNTACIEVRTRSNDLIILDAGSGIRRLGVTIMQDSDEKNLLEKNVEFLVEGLVQEMNMERSEGLRALEGSKPYKKEIHLFLTHYHWDHIQGFPFFLPAFIPGYTLNVYGHLKSDHRLMDVFEGQQSKTYFPVYLDVMQAEKNFYEIAEDTIQIGDTLVTSRHINHPQGCLGYRICCGEMVVTYATDNEHPEDGSMDPAVLELAENSDIFIYDCQYTPEEYPMKKNWGHSTWEQGVRIAREAGVKKFVLFHHDPERNDEAIARMEAEAREQFPNTMAAYEGLELVDFPCEPTEMPEIDPEAPQGESQLAISGHTLLAGSGPALASLSRAPFRDDLSRALTNGVDNFRLDCSGVQTANRKDLMVLADLVDELNRRRIPVTLHGYNDALEHLLKITRFNITTKMKK